MKTANGIIDLLLIGTGEYTTGYISGSLPAPDKHKGVIALVAVDLRRRHKVDQISLVGTNGTKMPSIRQHLRSTIADCYKDMDTTLTRTYPDDFTTCDPMAYVAAMDAMRPGSGVIIVTPDDTHYEIVEYAIRSGLHVLITKPPTKTARQQRELAALAQRFNVYVQVEYHKRFDPIYQDARNKIRQSGQFTLFQSYMSQPKSQLKTFKAWAGISSDISYYLNSHHIDIHSWAMQGLCHPTRVTGFKSSGVAEALGSPTGTEDAITLVVDWESSSDSRSKGVAIYCAGWTSPNACEVHSQQRFTCLCESGEVRVDQAHRGYEYSIDGKYSCLNPLFMKYSPDDCGYFSGQHSYGYLSIEAFVDAVIGLNSKTTTLDDLNSRLPTIHNTLECTAILEAGRESLDNGGCPVTIGISRG